MTTFSIRYAATLQLVHTPLSNIAHAWIIGRTFRHIRKAKQYQPSIGKGTFNINLSGETIADQGTLEFIRRNLQVHEIDPSQICFEITETSATANMAGALELMSELKCDGCQFALDDFGGILSSCGYLKALPVNYLKIGGNFVKSLDTQNIDFVMVQSINEVGHAIQLKTIVEFVKTRATLDKLKLLGVDFAQGYAVGRPTRALKEPGEQSS